MCVCVCVCVRVCACACACVCVCVDEVSAAVAELESTLRDDGLAPDLHLQPEGN